LSFSFSRRFGVVLQDSIHSGLLIDDLVLVFLLFADDMAIFGKTPALLLEYCNTWGLEVNASKTKIMVFRKRGGLNGRKKWTYNGMGMGVVDSFNYLGTLLSYNGIFYSFYEYLVGKSLKALNMLLCQLFDSFVGAILNYFSEICGFSKSK